MAIGMMIEGPEWTREQYEEMNERMFGTMAPSPAPEGLILHTAGKGPNGWRVVDVWESREHFERFLEDQVMPAAEEMGAPSMSEPEVWELHNILRGERAAV
jgi:quinol monooxygenase YgiN